jgi:hypothetical protein
MVRIVIIIFVLVSTVACEDSIKEDPYKIPDGVYIGTFIRTPAWQLSDTANVTITFSNNSWTGQSDRIDFPILGEGAYKIENKLINFTNLTEVIPGFDTTLILSGEFQFNKSNTSLEIFRYYYSPVWGWDMPDEDHYTLIGKK